MRSRLVTTAAMVCAVGLAAGCASPGGRIIGPVSYAVAKGNERSMTARAVSRMPDAAQRANVLALSIRGEPAEEIEAQLGIDMGALMDRRTEGEGRMSWAAMGADALLYGVAAWLAVEASDGGGGGSSAPPEPDGIAPTSRAAAGTSRDIIIYQSGAAGHTAIIYGDSFAPGVPGVPAEGGL